MVRHQPIWDEQSISEVIFCFFEKYLAQNLKFISFLFWDLIIIDFNKVNEIFKQTQELKIQNIYSEQNNYL